jgi:group I intron endonuclease
MVSVPDDLRAIIYVITCQETGAKYVGQTKSHKKTRGKWYKYGIAQRMVEHIGAARRKRTTPIARAILQYGAAVFSIEELERCELDQADTREAYFIAKLGTLHPKGYNVQRNSKCGNGSLYVKGEVLAAELRGIKTKGTLSKVRVLLQVKGEKEKTRVMFGSSSTTYEESITAAKRFCEDLGIVPVEHSSLRANTEPWWPYKEKIEKLDDSKITRLRVVPFSTTQVMIGVKTKEMKSWEEEVSMVFGSKKIARRKSFGIALSVADEIAVRHTIVGYSVDVKLLG